jgi:membrane fusion protein (multidrug efflux system)
MKSNLERTRMDARTDEANAGRPKPAPRIEVVPAGATPPPAAKQQAPGRRRRVIALGALAAVAVGGVAYGLDARRFEETDDAQVDGDISNLAPRIAGTVKAVHVVENQAVRKGELLAELDPADMEAAAAEARAAVAAAEAELEAADPTVSITATSNRAAVASSASDLASARAAAAEARKTVAQIAAQLAQAEANDRTAQLERQRAEKLFAGRAVSQAEVDQRVNAALAAAANVESIRHALEAARDRIGIQEARVATTESRAAEVRANGPRELETRRAGVAGRRAAVDLARARLVQAELNLAYTKITAPADGIVGKKAVTVGDRVGPGQPIMAISQVGDLWVTANFRETQLRRLRPGQPADLYIDGLATTLRGHVESIGGATGSRYSVLPPENASGNYVKVVQRVPVRLRLDAGQPGLDRLRPGLSVEPKVTVR